MPRQPVFWPCLALVAVFAAPAAYGQESKDEKPWKLEEAVGAPDWLMLAGSIRPRYETLTNTVIAGRQGGDELLNLQTVLDVELKASDFVLGAELLDSRLLSGNAGGGAAGEVDTLEASQLYAAWRPKDLILPGDNLDLTVGRFTIDAGSRRLIARANYRSILQSFDGARVVWESPRQFKLMAFYTHPTTRLPADTPSALDNETAFNRSHGDVRFSGANFEIRLPAAFAADIYSYDLDESDSPGNATRDRRLTTSGVRVDRAPADGKFDLEAEYIRQTGTVRATTNAADMTDLDHDADFFHLQAGYTFDVPWSPRVALQYDQASGDESPTDLSSERFDSLFGDRSFEFGPTSIFGVVGRTNLISPGVRIEVKPGHDSDAYLAVRQIRLESARDSFANTNVRDVSGASGDDVGTQIEVRYRRWLVPDSVRLTVGGAAILKGEFLDSAPNRTINGDTMFGYTDITWSF